jgi:hypothetical protein
MVFHALTTGWIANLFADKVRELRLEVGGTDWAVIERTHTCERDDDGRYLLANGGDEAAPWRVWHRDHCPSESALALVGEAIRREKVRVSYAAPLSDARERGAFFPLKDVSSTRGIINAPWQVNDDRTNLLPGAFNEELLDVVAELVVEALPEAESVSASWELAPREIAERIEVTPPRAEARVGAPRAQVSGGRCSAVPPVAWATGGRPASRWRCARRAGTARPCRG